MICKNTHEWKGRHTVPCTTIVYGKVTVAFVFALVICWFSLRADGHHCICPFMKFAILEIINELFSNDFADLFNINIYSDRCH